MQLAYLVVLIAMFVAIAGAAVYGLTKLFAEHR